MLGCVCLIAGACISSWVVIALVIGYRGELPSLPISDLYGWRLLLVIGPLVALACVVLLYEILFFRVVAVPIVRRRPDPELDKIVHGRLLEGTDEPLKKDRAPAEVMFTALTEAIAVLTTTERLPVEGGKPRNDLSPEIQSPEELVGADRTRLGSELQKQIDSNTTLARARAETVRKLLEDATKEEAPLHRISSERVLITVTGPCLGEPNQKSLGIIMGCSDTELNKDRTVEVWLPGPLPNAGK